MTVVKITKKWYGVSIISQRIFRATCISCWKKLKISPSCDFLLMQGPFRNPTSLLHWTLPPKRSDKPILSTSFTRCTSMSFFWGAYLINSNELQNKHRRHFRAPVSYMYFKTNLVVSEFFSNLFLQIKGESFSLKQL